MKANWNDQITLHLNERGVKIYKDVYPGSVTPGLSGNELKIRLWDAAKIFGPHFSLGFGMPFEDANFDGMEALNHMTDYAEDPRCPHCGAEALEWTPDVTFNGTFISQKVVCESCGKSHEAIYELSDYEEKS